MNIDDPRHPWSRLTASARRLSGEGDLAAPYGFSTRTAALGCAIERRRTSLYDRFALGAVGLSCLLAALSVAANFSSLNAEPGIPELVFDEYDAVAVLMDG
jgi:hypothetical protein